MFVTMRAVLCPQPGDRLLYDCPLKGGDYRSEQFFDKYRGKSATFVGFSEKLIGLLDFKGREPGRYINPDGVKVRFEGETQEYTLNHHHLILLNPREHDVVSEEVLRNLEMQRVGDLPRAIPFYPGDMVMADFGGERPEFATDTPREVSGVSVDQFAFADGEWKYHVYETLAENERRVAAFMAKEETLPEDQRHPLHHAQQRQFWNLRGEQLRLIQRGNVYHLYHDPSLLSFTSDEEEVRFWLRSGISRPQSSDHTLADALSLFKAGQCDVIDVQGPAPRFRQYYSHILLDRWATHRERVRTLTERLYKAELASEAA